MKRLMLTLIKVVNGSDDLLCIDHKMATGYEESSWSFGGDGVL